MRVTVCDKAPHVSKVNVRRGAIVVGPEAHETGDDRLVRAVAFAGSCEGSMQLDPRALRRSADEPTGEKTESTRPRRMRARRTNHDRTDDIEQTDHRTRWCG